MPYTTNPPTTSFDPVHALPQHLAHKPVYALPYSAFDGPYAGNTDMQYITVGLSQWDPDEISIKTMRFVRAKWTRQAEEIPLHRAVDMALFLAKAVFDSSTGSITLPAGTLSNQTSEVTISEEQRGFGEMASYQAALTHILPELKDRFNALLQVLTDLKSTGKI